MLDHQVFGDTGFQACAGVVAQPGKAVPLVRKTCELGISIKGEGEKTLNLL
jgi:hypothetical protein